MSIGVEPTVILVQLVVCYWSVADAGRWCSFESAICYSHVGLTDWEKASTQRHFRGFNVGKEFIVSH
jgi:hypothetical protein